MQVMHIWSARLSVIGVLCVIIAAVGFRFAFQAMPALGLADSDIYDSAQSMASQALPVLVLAGGVAGVVGALLGVLVLSQGSRRHRGQSVGERRAMLAIVCGLLAAAPSAGTAIAATQAPPIHDISTDLENPPQFSAAMFRRGPGANSLDRTHPANLAELQLRHYPGITTLRLPLLSPEIVFNAAYDQARIMNLEIISARPDVGDLELMSTSFLMGFEDDMVVRVRPAPDDDAVLVDVRSVSRFGINDLGVNATRIQKFMQGLNTLLHNPLYLARRAAERATPP